MTSDQSKRLPVVYADFQSADPSGRVRLNTEQSLKDLVSLGPSLQDGQLVELRSEELVVCGTLRHSDVEEMWVAEIRWREIRETE